MPLEAFVNLESSRAEVIQRVVSELDHYTPEASVDGKLFADFVRVTVGRVRGPFLAQHTPRQVLRKLEAAFVFAQQRPAGTVHAEIRKLSARGVAVLTHVEDHPFIVDTVRLFLRRNEAEYWGGFNVVFPATRDADGQLIAVGEEGGVSESLAWLEADVGQLEGRFDEASEALRHQLRLARATVEDFESMTGLLETFAGKCDALAEAHPDQAESYRETAAFLKWLMRENFVFMGAESDGEKYGIQKIDGPYYADASGDWTGAPPPGTVYVRKAHQESPIHRAGRIDEILISLAAGTPDAAQMYLRGMFTYRAVTQPCRNVPILRKVLKRVLDQQEAEPGSYRYKGIANVFDSLPTEFLFTTSEENISQMVDLVFESEQRQEVGVTFLTRGNDSAFALVSLPKTQYSDELRQSLEEEITHTMGSSYVDHGTFMGRFDTVLQYYYLTGLKDSAPETIQMLTERIRVMATPWASRLWREVAGATDEDRADYLYETYRRAFPISYMQSTSASRAYRDIQMLEALSGDQDILADVFEERGSFYLRVYQTEDIFLTDLLPVLDNFGLTVKASDVVRVDSRGARLSFDTFELSLDPADKAAFMAHNELLVDALPHVFGRQVDDDPLNALVLTAGLSWEAVDVLRAYTHYSRQILSNFNLSAVQDIMLSRPDICAALYRLFEARFHPDLTEDRVRNVMALRAEVKELLRRTQTHDEDRVFGTLRNLIEATLRTNAWRTDRVHHYLSFKFECGRIDALTGNVPLYEIYVHSPEVEGVHLRFGTVARGGLRWSDRSDYRTEVLGLVTTQQVKNVVIVPEGSKGGFLLRHPHPDRGQRREDADRLYKTFIRGLLDLTDNVVDGEIVHPPRVVFKDAPDPYLVVAADKGTAHLSDTANGLSIDYGFWLGDAFASGGSNGYDHKGVGITARGAWVLVRRHFAEMGRDPYSEPFTAIGVGDMGGDVFGNGLIETPYTKLVAAFNHMHIFIDPDPDPASSYAERKRMFDLAGREAGWDFYNKDLISEGGGVFDRSAKSITLSEKAMTMLGLPKAEVEPEAVIRAILKLDVDLFWSGGIGTYVKASYETHADADDRGNDGIRVDASELGCKVVGEGANLSFTQQGRIEAGLNGIRLNTDFIDNSAGVDMSDHEVNLKILLGGPVNRGDLTDDARNALLEKMTEEVASLVLANNDIQGRQISRDALRAKADIFPFARAMAFLERQFSRTRESFDLPTDEELDRRVAHGEGLTRPELATISSHVKRFVFAELMASGRAKELLGYQDFLVDYFPVEIQERYAQDIQEHQLADEIAMTMACTRVVGDAGAAFVPMMVESTGRTVFEVVDAYLRAQYLANAYEVRSTLEELRTSVSLSALYDAWVKVDEGARDLTGFWLGPGNHAPELAVLDDMREAADQVYELQADEVAKANASQIEEMLGNDIPESVAHAVLKAQYLNIALMVWSHARRYNLSHRDTVIRQLAAGRASRLQEIIDDLSKRPAEGQWEPVAMAIMVQRFSRLLRDLMGRLPDGLQASTVDELEPVLAGGPLADVRAQVDAMVPEDGKADLAALLVLEERLAGAIAKL